MGLFDRRKKKEKTQDQRLDRAESTARDHARRLLRLEAEAGIYLPSPMANAHDKERTA